MTGGFFSIDDKIPDSGFIQYEFFISAYWFSSEYSQIIKTKIANKF